MIKLEITAETPEAFRAQLEAFMPRIAAVERVQIAAPGGVVLNDVPKETVIVDEPAPAEEQAVRRKRRSKAEVEAEKAAPEPVKEEKAPEPELLYAPMYAYSAASDTFFVIEAGKPAPTDADIAQGDLEFFETEQEWSMYKARHERQQAKKAGVASKFEGEVAEAADAAEPKETTSEDLMTAVNELLDAFGDENDVAAGAAVMDIVNRIGKAKRMRDVEPERRTAVLKALQAAKALAPKKGKR